LYVNHAGLHQLDGWESVHPAAVGTHLLKKNIPRLQANREKAHLLNSEIIHN